MLALQHLLWNQEVEIYNAWEQCWTESWTFQDNRNHHMRLWLIQSGEIEGCFENRSYRARQGDICFWPSAKSIRFRNIGGGELRYLTILFTLRSNIGLDFRSCMEIPVFLRNMDKDRLEGQMRMIVREYEDARIGYEMIAKARLQEILVELVRAGNYSEWKVAADIGSGRDKPFRLWPIIRHLAENPASYPTSREMADMLQISEVHSRRLFKKTVSMTPNQFVQQLKVDQSKRLLRETTLSTSEIAYKIGFESPNYFAKVFRRHVGYSPKDFRQLTGVKGI